MVNEFDLIPLDYRQRLSRRRIAFLGGMAAAGTLSVILLLHIVLTWLNGNVEKEIAELQRKQAISVQQRNRLSELSAREKYLAERLKFFTGLRGGAVASSMFVTIDRAMNASDVWFESWQFQRSGYVVKQPLEGRNTGYFIIIPEETETEDSQAWMIETHMNIRGRALDHSALSGFVGQLFRQPAIDDVRILDTSLAANGQFVEFNLAITVNNFGPSSSMLAGHDRSRS